MTFSEITESVRIAFDSLRQNKLRSLLASLGIVIGISFVIIMGWILAGLDNVLESTIDSMGQDMLYVDKWSWAGGHNWKLMEQRKNITLQQANDFCKRITSAEVAIPQARKMGVEIKYKNENYSGISIQGTRSEYAAIPGGSVTSGRFFNKNEEEYSCYVVVLGYGVNKTIFPNEDAIGKVIKIGGRKFTVIGIAKQQGTMLMDFVDNQVFVPLPTFLSAFGSYNRSFTIAVKAGKTEYMDQVRSETEGLMRMIRNIKPGQPNDFGINETETLKSEMATFRMWVWGIGIGMTLLSFLVGVIGIMNIMFVTVTERTKEIGIRKAIGAKNRSILMQFVVEAASLSFFGAILSFILCSGIIYAAATILPKFIPSMSFLSPVVPLNLLLIATFVSIFVGMLAGLTPAYRAAKLDPVDALRFD